MVFTWVAFDLNCGKIFEFISFLSMCVPLQINEDLIGEVFFMAQTGPFSIPLHCTTKKCDVSFANFATVSGYFDLNNNLWCPWYETCDYCGHGHARCELAKLKCFTVSK